MAGTTLGTAYVQIVPSAQGIKGSITNAIGGEAEAAGTSAGGKIASFAKKALAGAAIGATVVKALKTSLGEGAKLQQSYIGGMDTLYGDAAESGRQYAREAAQAGISMNDYAENAVSFGAALKSAFGGDSKKAMKSANTALMDMADNSAKMGTPIEQIQTAYQGFAKGQYQLLDNLKLGYGGTKTEMQRLLKDAQKITGVKYDINNLGDVYEAIHVVQGELGLTGTAAKEAKTTLSGSFGAMKAAAQNLAGSLALGENVKPALDTFMTTFDTFFSKNLIPMIKTVIKGIPTIVATLVKEGIPSLLDKISTFIKTLADGLKAKADTLTSDKVKNWAVTTIPKLLKSAGDLIGKFASGLIQNLPKIVTSIGKIALAIITGLGSAIWPKITEAANGIKDKFLAPIRALRDKAKEIFDALKTAIKEKVDALKESVKEKIDSMKESVKTKIDAMKESVKTKIDSMKESVKEKIDAMKESVKTKIDALKTAVKEKFDAIKEKIVGPIETAKEKVKDVVDKIKSIIGGVKLQLPKFKLPHLSVSAGEAPFGIGGKGKLPSFSVEWYAKGGVFDSPSLIGVGEKGPEAVVPLDKLWKHLDNAKSGDVTINVYASEGMNVNDLASEVERRLVNSVKRKQYAWG